ncbi:hypothetical protein [Paraburkholderia sp. DHOC27]|uniref:hypothetical protein n=1 Tax=Paraburkholderia sp. DHOC27 TaxID=2303330 RepID=UPI000E3B769C|nr:hypothetical protein [Paraburkholderia sp. DHOC27]RFU49249.1 hypothetical protein D0B32_05435 [Paraburkholderia sp. DHOC27]
MEKKVLVAAVAALVSSVGALHSGPARAADAGSVYEDSTVDASLDPGEERVSSDADNKVQLKDLRYAYFIGYNARAREDSKSYSTLTDEVKHPQKQFTAPAMPAAPKPVAERAPERVAVTRQVVQQTATSRHVAAPVTLAKQMPAPVAAPKREAVTRAASSRQIVARAEPAPVKHVAAPAAPLPAKRVYAQAEPQPVRRAAAPVAPTTSLKQVSVQVASPKRVDVPPLPPRQLAATHATPLKLAGVESEPPILIPTQAVTALPEDKPARDDAAQVAQNRETQHAQRATARYRQTDDDAQYASDDEDTGSAQATQAAPSRPSRQYQNPPAQAYAPAPVYNQASTESDEPRGYAGRQYAPPPPPPPGTVQGNPYAPAQYQAAYGQAGYVPRPPAQAAAQQVVIVARPPAYPAYNEMYTPPELRRSYRSGYTNPPQPATYQGWE